MKKMVFEKFILGTGARLNECIENNLGGVIFFSKDIESREQFTNLISNLKSKSKNKLFLSIDQEGGRVERTENIHARYLSPRFAYQKGENFLIKQTKKMAKELLEYGINLNFAPCADVNTNPKNPIIGERSFSDNSEDVSRAVRIVSNVYRNNHIIPCLKHFPGHGDASSDSHLTLPLINIPMGKMEDIHIKPFRDNIDTEMIMAAHLHCTCFEKEEIPTSLSKNAIGYLRNILNYKGVIISDDMVMKGVQKFGSLEACIRGIEAGLDMFIYREANDDVYNLIQNLIFEVSKSQVLTNLVKQSNERILKLKKERLR